MTGPEGVDARYAAPPFIEAILVTGPEGVGGVSLPGCLSLSLWLSQWCGLGGLVAGLGWDGWD